MKRYSVGSSSTQKKDASASNTKQDTQKPKVPDSPTHPGMPAAQNVAYSPTKASKSGHRSRSSHKAKVTANDRMRDFKPKTDEAPSHSGALDGEKA